MGQHMLPFPAALQAGRGLVFASGLGNFQLSAFCLERSFLFKSSPSKFHDICHESLEGVWHSTPGRLACWSASSWRWMDTLLKKIYLHQKLLQKGN